MTNFNDDGRGTKDAGRNLEELAQAAHRLTLQRFGRTIKLYAPVYLSNECTNGCLYCGFNAKTVIPRRTLTIDEAVREVEAVTAMGHRHLLFVSGEAPAKLPLETICKIVRRVRSSVASISVEIMPQSFEGYKMLSDAGCDGVTLYQETYDEKTYKLMHPFGPKSDFSSRLAAIDAAGRAGMRFLGIGALLGLSDWREEAVSLIAHARDLMNKYWRSQLTVSVPRLRGSTADFNFPNPVSDRDFAQMICILRLALPDCGISLSTREQATLRDSLIPLGVTQMSAGSVTRPGGYSEKSESGEQFSIEDSRKAVDVEKMIREKGYDPVWKDWF